MFSVVDDDEDADGGDDPKVVWRGSCEELADEVEGPACGAVVWSG